MVRCAPLALIQREPFYSFVILVVGAVENQDVHNQDVELYVDAQLIIEGECVPVRVPVHVPLM